MMDAAGGHGDCDDIVHRLYHFLDGELDAGRRLLIQAHLDDCMNCLEAFDFEAELRQVIARKCRDQVPEALRVRISLSIQHPLGPQDGPFGAPPPL